MPLRDTVPLEAIQLDSDLTYEEKPVKILEYASRVTRSKVMQIPNSRRYPTKSEIEHMFVCLHFKELSVLGSKGS